MLAWMDVEDLRTLLVVCQAGSLSAAGLRLRLPVSTVSRRIAGLEQQVGAPLLERTGRGIRVLPAGERFAEHAAAVLRGLDLALADARGERHPEAERLRISVPLEMGLSLLPDVAVELSRRHPRVELEVLAQARRVALLEEEVDLALRLGPLHDSGLLARTLGEVRLVPCAAPTYLDAAGPIARPEALAEHPWVLVGGVRDRIELHGPRTVALQPRGRVRVSTFFEAARIAAAGGGLVLLPSYTAASHLVAGTLLRLVPRWISAAIPVHSLRPAHRRGHPVLDELHALAQARLVDCEREVARRRPSAARAP